MKYILIILFSLIFTQQQIETREFIIYKKSDSDIIDFSNYINFTDGNYILTLSNITSFVNNNPKKTLIEKCELKIVLGFDKNNKKVLINDFKGIEASLCENIFATKRSLRLNKNNHNVKVFSSNQKNYECEFVFWITGKFNNDNININKNNHGYLREWFNDDQLYIEYKFNNGKKDGEQKRWYVNGQQEILYYYKNGKLDGLQLKWYPSGILKSRMNYLSDKQNGKSEEWYANGNLKYVKIFDNGTLINLIESYDINGQVN